MRTSQEVKEQIKLDAAGRSQSTRVALLNSTEVYAICMFKIYRSPFSVVCLVADQSDQREYRNFQVRARVKSAAICKRDEDRGFLTKGTGHSRGWLKESLQQWSIRRIPASRDTICGGPP